MASSAPLEGEAPIFSSSVGSRTRLLHLLIATRMALSKHCPMANFGIYAIPAPDKLADLLISGLQRRKQRAPAFLLSALSKLMCYVAPRDAEPSERSI
jgi:hypothetical protein